MNSLGGCFFSDHTILTTLLSGPTPALLLRALPLPPPVLPLVLPPVLWLLPVLLPRERDKVLRLVLVLLVLLLVPPVEERGNRARTFACSK